MTDKEKLEQLIQSKYQNPYHGLICDFPIEPFNPGISKIHRMDDERIIVSRKINYWSLLIALGIGNLIILITGLIHSSTTEILSSILLLILLCFLSFLHHRWICATFEFNRKEQSISFPRGFFSRKTTLDFQSVKFEIKEKAGAPGMPGGAKRSYFFYLVKKDDSVKSKDLDISFPYKRSWSWILWYMDKHRVLPPGERLNAYRSMDAARLRGLNYPEALLRSTFYFDYITKEYIESVKELDQQPDAAIAPIDEKSIDELIKEYSE